MMNNFNFNSNATDMSNTEVKTTKKSVKFDTAEDVADLVEAINAHSDTLLTLTLEGNSYGIESARAIGEAISTAPALKHLHFNDMFISRLKDEIPEVLRLLFGGIEASGARIETLNLSDNAIGPVAMPALLPFLASPACSTLTVLRVNNCGLGPRGGNMLASELHRLEHLRELVIGRNRLQVDGVCDVAGALAKLTRLEVLEMPENSTKGPAIDALMAAVRSNPNLTILNLNDNVLKRKGALVGETVASLRRLQVLNLGDCLLGTDGCLAVLSALQQLASSFGAHYLRELIINGNEIGKAAGETIASTVESLLASRASGEAPFKLDLSCNNLGEDLVERLQARLAGSIDLVLNDDEGSDVEGGDGEEEEGDEEEEDNQGGGGDEVKEASPLKNGKPQRKSGPPPTLESLIAKHEAAFTSLEDLASKYFWVATKGFKEGSLSDRAKLELEALAKVGLTHQDPDQPLDLANHLLVACGLIKSEIKELAPPKDVDLTGGIFALAGTMKMQGLPSVQKSAVKSFIVKAIEDEKYVKVKPAVLAAIYSF